MDGFGAQAPRGAVLISGASTGIGRECALRLARAGFQVYAGVRSKAAGESLEQAAPERLKSILLDITDAGQIDFAADIVSSEPLRGLVNNAGVVVGGPLEFLPLERIRLQFEVNLFGHIALTQALLPGLRRSGGRIVNMSSVTGPLVSNPRGTIYSAAKAGIMGMTRAQAIELAEYNITVNGIGPGWIETPSSSPEEIFAGKQSPIGRPGTADEIGHVAVFLASEEASFVTGQLIVADGGNTLMEYKGPAEGYY